MLSRFYFNSLPLNGQNEFINLWKEGLANNEYQND